MADCDGESEIEKQVKKKLESSKLIRVKLPQSANDEVNVLRVSPSSERKTKG